MMAWLPPDPLQHPRALLRGQRCCLSEDWASPGLLREGGCRVRHLGVCMGPWRDPWLGPQTLEMGTFPPFPEAQQMVEHLASWSQALLMGLGMDKTQAVVSHQPPLPVCSSINPRALAHNSSHGVPGSSWESWHFRAPPALLTAG